ncbi:tetratricopeptide repeat protein [Methylobacterium tarhaniae]|uniref:O-linked N-acetylglucosamine transferase, SPINDLY family protein n=1 Tax=Methylobacterium tarhaniae TaxID=1187852 RepID=UPI003CFDD3F4
MSPATPHPDAVALLRRGNARLTAGAPAEALALYGAALERAPALAEAWFGLGGALVQLSRAREAEEACHRGLRHAPAHRVGLANLGVALSSQGRYAEAQGCFEAALGRDPGFVQAQTGLAHVLLQQNQVAAAQARYEHALSLDPDLPDARTGLADLLNRTGRPTQACALAAETLRRNPDHVPSRAALFDLLVRSTRFAEAEALFEAWEGEPVSDPDAASRVLMGLNLLPGLAPERIAAAHRAWGAAQEAAAAAAEAAPVRAADGGDRDPERRLRIGYVSADLHFHPVGRFLLPLLAAHDKRAVHVTCYSQLPGRDAVTGQIAACADLWRACQGMGTDELAALIASDGIDILVDLSGHTFGNRLDVLARRPAPVQVSWLGYLNTTGLAAIDYRITDPIADPPGPADALSAEALIRLPRLLCFAPPAAPPPVAEPPARAGRGAVLGVCNRAEKINPVVAGLWARVLAASPGSRLLVRTGNFADEDLRRRVHCLLTGAGIPAGRLDLAEDPPDYTAYLAAFAEIDILLDPTPYGGLTTTCEALWQGVPAVTLAGDRQAGRVVASALTAAGLPDFVAASPDAYVRIAAGLADDVDRLTALRRGMRERLRGSALCDARGFGAAVEAAYRTAWRRFCAGEGATALTVA